MTAQPTIFHVTNHKAGSQWVAEILKHSAPERIVKPEVEVRHFLERASIPGRVYPTVYVTRQHFINALLTGRVYRYFYSTNILKNLFASMANLYNYRYLKYPYKTFVVIRDLRDILVSAYFSFLISHKIISSRIKTDREHLNNMDQEEGFLYLLAKNMQLEAMIQSSWHPAYKDGEILLVRYEELIEDEHGMFEKIIKFCEIDVDNQRLHEIIKYNSFSVATGRKRGQENVKEHLRKGIVGDWKNHLSGRVKNEFKRRYGQVLIDTGYESNYDW